MTRLGVALGAQRETFMGLAGLGDLVLTCTDDQSRNRRFGLLLAPGSPRRAALREIGQVVEGYAAARALHAVAAARGRGDAHLRDGLPRALRGPAGARCGARPHEPPDQGRGGLRSGAGRARAPRRRAPRSVRPDAATHQHRDSAGAQHQPAARREEVAALQPAQRTPRRTGTARRRTPRRETASAAARGLREQPAAGTRRPGCSPPAAPTRCWNGRRRRSSQGTGRSR